MRQQHEARIQKQIVDFIRYVAPELFVFAVPNGAQRTATGRPANAVAGMVSGAPDLCVLLPDGGTLWIECKAPKGRLSDNQIHFHLELHKRGHNVIVARSIDDVKIAFEQFNIKTREA